MENQSKGKRSSYKGRKVNALALGAEERRGKLRKALGRSKHPLIQGYLNGATRRCSYIVTVY